MRSAARLRWALLVALLSSCSCRPPSHNVAPPPAQGVAPATGQVVAEIDPRIWCIHQDRDGNYWFGNNGNGAYRYDGQRLYHLKLSESPAEEAHRARYPDTAFSPSGVYSIYKDRRGHLWFGTAGVGLCRYDGQRLTTTPGGGAFGIRSIYQDRAGDFWVCNTRQRFEISPEVTLKDGHSLIKYVKKEGLPDAQSDMDRNFTYTTRP